MVNGWGFSYLLFVGYYKEICFSVSLVQISVGYIAGNIGHRI